MTAKVGCCIDHHERKGGVRLWPSRARELSLLYRDAYTTNTIDVKANMGRTAKRKTPGDEGGAPGGGADGSGEQ
eukprot:g16506.t1